MLRTRRTTLPLALTLLAAGGAARAQPVSFWRGELRVEAGYLTSSTTSSAGTSQNAQLIPRLSATWWLAPLVDDPAHPLQLLPFFQHVGSVVASVTDTVGLLDGTLSLPAPTLSATFFPWRDTGFTGSVTVSPAAGALNTSHDLGLTTYLLPVFRLDVMYLGVRNSTGQTQQAAAAPTPTGLQASTYASDRGRLTLTGVVLDDHLELSATGEVGPVSNTTWTANLTKATLSTAVSQGLYYSGAGTLTGYLGRRFSLAASGGLRAVVRSTSTDGGTAVAGGTSNPFGLLALQLFVSDSFLLRLSDELDRTTQVSAGAVTSTNTTNTATLALAGRF